MVLIDVSGLFREYLLSRMKDTDPEELEETLPDLYIAWLDTPNDKLKGVCPNDLFHDYDAHTLIDILTAYANSTIDPPDPLLDAIAENPDTQALLLAIVQGKAGGFTNANAQTKACKCAIDLLNQMGADQALDTYIDLLLSGDDALCDGATQGLAILGERAREKLIAAYERASLAAADRILDLLADLPKDERVFSMLVRAFKERQDKCGFYASLLMRYDDERALPVLDQAIRTGYAETWLDFTAIRDALEAFGGIVVDEPKYLDDPDYIKMSTEE